MNNDNKIVFYTFVVLISGCLLYLLSPILTPFVCSAFLAYLGDPIVDRLETKQLSRTVSVSIVFFIMLLATALVLLFIVPILEQQISLLLRRIPQAFDWLEFNLLPYITNLLNIDQSVFSLEKLRENLTNHWRDVGGIASEILLGISASGKAVLAIFANMMLIPVVTFYLLCDWDLLVARVHELIPRDIEPTVNKLAKECDSVLGEFLHGQLLLMLAQGIFYAVALWVIGIEFSLLIGMLAGLVSFVPYLGVIFGVVVSAIAAFVQYQDVIHVVYVFIIFGIGQTLEGVFLSPLLVGDRIGLHPVAVIFAVMAGGQLFGFIGVLLALPIAAIIVILLRHAHERYLASQLYSD